MLINSTDCKHVNMLTNAKMSGAYRAAEGAAAPHPVCWANKASRAIFTSQSSNIGLL
jgi:hypothetical protein